MNDRVIVDYWMEKARDDIASARDNHVSGRYQNAVRDTYFACMDLFSKGLRKRLTGYLAERICRRHWEAKIFLQGGNG